MKQFFASLWKLLCRLVASPKAWLALIAGAGLVYMRLQANGKRSKKATADHAKRQAEVRAIREEGEARASLSVAEANAAMERAKQARHEAARLELEAKRHGDAAAASEKRAQEAKARVREATDADAVDEIASILGFD